MSIRNTPAIRNVLYADGAAGLGAGLVVTFGAGLLSPFLGIPEGLLFWAGVGLFGCVALIATMAFRTEVPRMMLFDLALINAIWAVASIAILVAGIVKPNLLGTLFIVAQAGLVGLFSVLQFAALRRPAGVSAA